MNEFWKNELDLFKEDVRNFKDFWSQPISFSEENLMLKPTFEETDNKVNCEGVTDSFWSREWNMFLGEMESVKSFLTQPVVLK